MLSSLCPRPVPSLSLACPRPVRVASSVLSGGLLGELAADCSAAGGCGVYCVGPGYIPCAGGSRRQAGKGVGARRLGHTAQPHGMGLREAWRLQAAFPHLAPCPRVPSPSTVWRRTGCTCPPGGGDSLGGCLVTTATPSAGATPAVGAGPGRRGGPVLHWAGHTVHLSWWPRPARHWVTDAGGSCCPAPPDPPRSPRRPWGPARARAMAVLRPARTPRP